MVEILGMGRSRHGGTEPLAEDICGIHLQLAPRVFSGRPGGRTGLLGRVSRIASLQGEVRTSLATGDRI